MNYYYASLCIDGIQTLLEFHYTHLGDQHYELLNYFDRHGDTPDLTHEQEQLILNDIRQFESNRPFGVSEQHRLAKAFNGVVG